MPTNGHLAPAGAADNNSGEMSEKEFRRIVDIVHSLFGLVSVFNTSRNARDLAYLEGLVKPGIEKQQEIDKLKTTLETLTSEKEDEIKKLKAENEQLTKDHASFEEQKKQLEIKEKKFQEERAANERDFKKKCETHEERIKQKTKAMKEELETESKKKTSDEIKEVKRKLEAKYSETERKTRRELNEKTEEAKSLEEEKKGLERQLRGFDLIDQTQRQEIENLKSDLQAVDPSRAKPKNTFDE